jgi:(p)ppGpp synthase/HD superfamily hydrolase
MTKTEEMMIFATRAHCAARQLRKYSGDWYIVHPMDVFKIVDEYCQDEETNCAALGHDILEDVAPAFPEFHIDTICEKFGRPIAILIHELTDQFTKENYPALNRKTRADLEAKRLATISYKAKNVKIADIIMNTSDIASADPGYAVMYIKEKMRVFEGLQDANEQLVSLLGTQLDRLKTELNIR